MPTHKAQITPDDHVQGNREAPVTLIEYGDYECLHCGHAYWAIKDLQAEYGDDLRFAYRNFPLTQMHPMAEPAAEAAEFAGSHGRFWEMHDAIYENQERLSVPMLLELAAGLTLDSSELGQALENRKFMQRIRDDFIAGVKAGVNGTPTFFINGVRHNGSHEDLGAAINDQLGSRRVA